MIKSVWTIKKTVGG